MGLTNPSLAYRRFLLLLTCRKLRLCLAPRPFSQTLLVGLNLSFPMGALVWFFEITKVALFESEAFCKVSLLALYYFLSLSMIFLLFCLLPLAALFMLTTCPFGPPRSWSLLRWRPRKEHWFNWSAGLSTGVFFPIRPIVRPPFKWISTKLSSRLSSPLQFHSNFSWGHLRPQSFLF